MIHATSNLRSPRVVKALQLPQTNVSRTMFRVSVEAVRTKLLCSNVWLVKIPRTGARICNYVGEPNPLSTRILDSDNSRPSARKLSTTPSRPVVRNGLISNIFVTYPQDRDRVYYSVYYTLACGSLCGRMICPQLARFVIECLQFLAAAQSTG